MLKCTSVEIRITLLLWISIFSRKYGLISSDYIQGVDIGHRCKYDAECTTGNGGEYAKCNRVLSLCICTINHLGEDKCSKDSDKYDGVCRRRIFYSKLGQCTLECSSKGTRKWREHEDWYGEIREHFASIVHDKKTSVCYDPRRAFNSLPDGFEIKQSTIPSAGLGTFTNIYIEQGTVFGPFKGIFEPDTDIALISGYSWKIVPHEDRSYVVWIDGKDVSQSNWMRYSNTPISASMENLVPVQYRGEMYYQAFKYIQPGTELLVWYGESYGEYLEIEEFDPPRYYYARPGYVGGACHKDDEGWPCQFDENTLCADQTCFCVPGTHIRAGKCIIDETLGGVCTGSNGDTCQQDINAVCQRGVCVCKNNTTPTNGICIPDEAFGGLCAANNGERCMLDNNTECVNGLCRCRYGTTGVNGKCMKDEVYQGRCIGEDGEECEDQNAECIDKICMCKDNASAINGKCVLDEVYQGRCIGDDGEECEEDQNAECIDKICVCKDNASAINETCELDETVGGKCRVDGKTCALDKNAECIRGFCRCKLESSSINGTCRMDDCFRS